jgi:sigma-B regulation protein RsbU (phosphoserine phosphatase)
MNSTRRAMKNRGIAFKLTLLMMSSITLILASVWLYNYSFSRRIITENVEKNARHLALATVNRIDSVLLAVQKVPSNMAQFLESFSYDAGDLLKLIRSMVENNPEIYGATIAFEPYAYSRNSHAFAPYFFKRDGKLEFTDIPYEYFTWDWYQIPKELDQAIWTEPYYDEGAGRIIMTTFSVPFYRITGGERIFMGVVTADVSLSWLQDIVSSIKVAQTGYGFLLSKNGTFVIHPGPDFVMNETIFSVAEARGDNHMRNLGREMIHGEAGFTPFKSLITDKDRWMVYLPVSSSGWSLGVLFPQDELMEDIFQLNRIVLFLSLAGFLLILVVIVLISGTITRPLRALSNATEQVAQGNLGIVLPSVGTKDEVGRLAESFQKMVSSLRQYIKELTETTAAKERIESELKIAHDIQMGILHKTFPAFPDRSDFDIYATLEPAREVGGDLYDFFFMDPDHLCFTIGDVSGKGMPAALFMAVTKTLLKTRAVQGLTPDRVLTQVNQDLSLDNPSSMFVTLFLGILDVRTGEVEYCNAGHNAPYLLRREADAEPLGLTQGIALGALESAVYHSSKVTLKEGDCLFLYTDGVTEAMNTKEALFTEKRLVAELGFLKEEGIRDMVCKVKEKIQSFSKGALQADDITIMALRYFGP